MRRLTLMTTLCLLFASACGKSTYRSAEGQFCSTDDDDDPFYECLLGMGLVCANTHSMAILDTDGGDTFRYQPLYLCRQACAPGDTCRQAGDVCCPANTYGRTYQDRPYACVPEEFCNAFTGDASMDAPMRLDARTAPRDTGSGDATSDAPQTEPMTDAGADAGGPTPDASSDAADAPLAADAPEADAAAPADAAASD